MTTLPIIIDGRKFKSTNTAARYLADAMLERRKHATSPESGLTKRLAASEVFNRQLFKRVVSIPASDLEEHYNAARYKYRAFACKLHNRADRRIKKILDNTKSSIRLTTYPI